MMGPLLPTELLLSLHERCKCHELQLKQLLTLYNTSYAAPANLVVYGLEGTGKFSAVMNVLEARGISYATVKCRDCLSVRHLLSKLFVACLKALDQLENIEQYARVETFHGLVAGLHNLMRDHDGKLVVVLDGIDSQRGASSTLLAALARLGETIPNLSMIFIATSTRPLHLQKPGIAHIHFPPFTRDELISMVTTKPSSDLVPDPDLLPPGSSTIDTATLQNLHSQFIATIYDSLVGPTTSASLPGFKSTCAKLWPPFIWPLLSSEPPPGKAKTWDFARLLVRNRTLFQSSGEAALIHHLTPSQSQWTFSQLAGLPPTTEPPTSTTTTKPPIPPLLKPFSALLLASSYLASHTAPKLDILLFSRHSSSKSSKSRRSYHRRKLFPHILSSSTATTTTSANATNIPRPFPLTRLLAITRAIHPTGISARRSTADRVYRHLAELERLRLVVPVAGGGLDTGEEERWRVNVGRGWVEGVARGAGVGLREFEVLGE